MNKFILTFFTTLLIFIHAAYSQSLQAGFDHEEYREILRINGHLYGPDERYKFQVPPPVQSTMLYRSKEMGLDNLYEIWIKDNAIAVFCTRGSVNTDLSWLANFYSAMVPATGQLRISKHFTFDYKLSDDANAAVHIGYLISTAFLSKDMLPKIDSLYNTGIKNIIIAGHSQGGGISYLLTAYFGQLQKSGRIPQDIRFKTYCTAAPKPGNLYFAYDYESKTYGWAYQIVNTKDWVPQTPFSVQKYQDLTSRNPVSLVASSIKKQGLKKRLAFRMLKNPAEKGVKNYQKILGHEVSKMIKKHLPDFEEPVYFPSNNYVRTGTHIILTPDEEYLKMHDESADDNMMLHHSLVPYYQLALKLPAEQPVK